MDDNDALSKIAMIQGIINNVIPVGKDGKPLRLDYQEKLDLIFTRETILQEKLDKLWKLIDEYGTKDDPLEHRPEMKKSRNSGNVPWVLAEIRRILES